MKKYFDKQLWLLPIIFTLLIFIPLIGGYILIGNIFLPPALFGWVAFGIKKRHPGAAWWLHFLAVSLLIIIGLNAFVQDLFSLSIGTTFVIIGFIAVYIAMAAKDAFLNQQISGSDWDSFVHAQIELYKQQLWLLPFLPVIFWFFLSQVITFSIPFIGLAVFAWWLSRSKAMIGLILHFIALVVIGLATLSAHNLQGYQLSYYRPAAWYSLDNSTAQIIVIVLVMMILGFCISYLFPYKHLAFMINSSIWIFYER